MAQAGRKVDKTVVASIRLAGGCEGSHNLVDAVRVVHRLTALFSLRVPKDLAEMQRQIRTHREGSGNQREAGGIRANHHRVY
jgi:hypothetical protein